MSKRYACVTDKWSRWISYCHNSHPFYYLVPSHTNKPLSPDTELLSCFSKHIHPLPALHFQPAASPPPSSLFSSSTRCSRRLVSIQCYPSSRLSCGMSFSLNQIQGNPLPWSINHLSVYTLLCTKKIRTNATEIQFCFKSHWLTFDFKKNHIIRHYLWILFWES